MSIRIGFTGTREGMTPAQKETFKALIEQYQPISFHHGCCIGADAEATEIVEAVMGAASINTVGYPSDLPGLTSDFARMQCTNICAPKHPLKRNRDIVDASELMIACPKGEPIIRSGTWSTVRYARSIGKPTIVIMTDGTIQTKKEQL